MILKLMSFCVSIVVSVTMPTVAAKSVEIITNQALYNDCNENPESRRFMFCQGFVSGVAEQMFVNGLSILGTMKLRGRDRADMMLVSMFSACANSKSDMSDGATVRAFVNWARHHPEEQKNAAWSGVRDALIEAYPCRLAGAP